MRFRKADFFALGFIKAEGSTGGIRSLKPTLLATLCGGSSGQRGLFVCVIMMMVMGVVVIVIVTRLDAKVGLGQRMGQRNEAEEET